MLFRFMKSIMHFHDHYMSKLKINWKFDIVSITVVHVTIMFWE